MLLNRRLRRYLQKHFQFGEQVASLSDSRSHPRIPLSAVWLAAFYLFIGRWRSLNAMEEELRRRPRVLRAAIGERLPSADTVGRVLEHHLDADQLRRMQERNLKRLRRMKGMHRRPDCRYRVGALDCHEQFATRHQRCPACLLRFVMVDGKAVVEYYHRFVFFQLVGVEPGAVVDVEPVHSGQDEVAAAERLMERIFTRYPWACEVIVADAAYQKAPFFRKLRAMGKHLVVTLKDERRDIFVDAASMQRHRQPVEVVEQEKQSGGKLTQKTVLRLWDFPELETWPQLGAKARAVYCQEQTTKRHRRGTEWVLEDQTHHWWWVTDLTVGQASVLEIMRMGRWRWRLENTFNEMVHHWGLDHRFKHGPNALVVFVLTLCIAHLLEWAFYLRAVQPEVRLHLTCVGLGQRLRHELGGGDSAPGCRDP